MIDPLEIHYSDGWAALYVDGNLECVGDSYIAEEQAFQILGVRQIQNDAFMRGQTSRDGVAQTLEEVEAYETERFKRQEKAEALREQANELLAQARELEDGC